MTRWIAFALLCTMGLFAAPATRAHHGWSGYDLSKEFTITAKIQKMTFDYPHVTVWVQPTDGSGKVWTAVLAPPSRMETRGATAARIQPGMTVKLTGYPNRNDPNEFRAERIYFGDDKVELR